MVDAFEAAAQYMQGAYCQVPAGCSGNLDSQGACCMAELSTDLICCEVLDRNMQCCASRRIDASGTCDGLSSSIDLQGMPCKVCPDTRPLQLGRVQMGRDTL